MVASCDRTDELDQGDDNAPDPARSRFCIAAKDLDGQCRSVRTRGIVGDRAEGKDDDAEATKAAEAVVAFEE